jgi:hypothetical protein
VKIYFSQGTKDPINRGNNIGQDFSAGSCRFLRY